MSEEIKLSKDITPQEVAIEQLKELQSVEEVIAFTADDERKGIQTAADERIAVINEGDSEDTADQNGADTSQNTPGENGKLELNPGSKKATEEKGKATSTKKAKTKPKENSEKGKTTFPSNVAKLLESNDEVYETGSGFLFTNKNMAQMEQTEYKLRLERSGKQAKDLKTYKK